MKSLVGAIIIFVILSALVVTNALYVNNIMENISELVFELETSGSEEKKNAVIDMWTDNRKLLSLSIEADELERMNDLIEDLRSTDPHNTFSEFQKLCRLISELATELSKYEKLSIEGIL